MWMVMRNMVLTWDKLHKNNKIDLGWYYLCKANEETNAHLLCGCPFTIQVWKEDENSLGLQNRWANDTNFKNLKC